MSSSLLLPTKSTTNVDGLIAQWADQEDGRLVLECLQYLDVATLIKKKPVNKHWQDLCTETVDGKCRDQKKAFESKDELISAVNDYIGSHNDHVGIGRIAETIAQSYGYPIGKWDVSNIEDFSFMFHQKQSFNEPIGSWDVSKAKEMNSMFCEAWSFNQDLSAWNVSNVCDMAMLFYCARSFNQDISSWDVSNVYYMDFMFHSAKSFNQDNNRISLVPST